MIPFSSLNKEHSILWYIKKIVATLIGISKLPFVIVIIIWMLIMSLLGAILSPVPILHRLFRRYTEILGTRALLFFLGFMNLQFNVVRLQQQKSTPLKTPQVQPGDIIVCNHSSYIDILYLAFKFSPIFAFGPNNWPKTVPMKGAIVSVKLTVISALLEVFRDPERLPEHCMPLHEAVLLARSYYAPLVVFPEGTTSNGKTLLSFVAPVFDGYLGEKKQLPTCHVLGIRYECEDFSPTYTVGNPLKHLVQLCCQLSNNLEAKFLGEDAANTTMMREITSIAEWKMSTHISTTLAAVLKIRKAQLNAKDKREFMDYWYSHKKMYKKE